MESNPWRRRDLFAKQCDRWETDCGSLPLLSSSCFFKKNYYIFIMESNKL